MKNRPQLAAVWVCSLVAVCGCSQSTETVSDGGGTIPPVVVPLAEPTPTASEKPVTASITNEADKLLAEEAFFVASAKALAFSREVQMYRQP